MKKNRELIALLSCGISLQAIIKIFFIYALFCGIFSFGITEFSVFTENKAALYYKTTIRKQPEKQNIIRGLWIKFPSYILYADMLLLEEERFQGIRLYSSSDSFQKLDAVYRIQEGYPKNDKLYFRGITTVSYEDKYFSVSDEMELDFPVTLDVIRVYYTEKMYLLGIKEIWDSLDKLSALGLNTEHLWVEINVRITNALYTVILALLALWIGFTIANPYVSVGCGILVAVFFFLFRQFFASLGNLHVINPIYSQWYVVGIWILLFVAVFLYERRKNK